MSVVSRCVIKRVILCALLLTGCLSAHVGSPDVFFQGMAGPYRLLVTIRPPDVIPGVARIEVRALSSGVDKIELTPTPMTGEALKHPPVADIAARPSGDPQYFEGALWLMGMGSWEIHVRATGARGSGELPVPVPAIALKTRPMNKGMGYFLFGMMVFLTVGMVAIVGAGAREALLAPGAPSGAANRKSVTGMLIASVVLIGALWYGKNWWASDAAEYSRKLYKPLGVSASLDGAGHMALRIADPGWLLMRRLDDLVPDHGHPMHLFLIRWPDMGEVFHLHPAQTATGFFETVAPPLPSGRYRLYADIVHDNGFAETAVGEANFADIAGPALTGDDAGGAIRAEGDISALPDGYRMVWRHDKSKHIAATKLELFSFGIIGPDGKLVNDLEPYMGMGGHAEFVNDDGSVFAHVHPTGSVPMASIAVASPHAMMAMHERNVGPEVSFPYGVPAPGHYRIFVQMKRAGRVETGGFAFTAR